MKARSAATLLLFTGIGLTAYTALQCVPMPIGWLAVIASHNADVWSRALAPLHEPGPSWAPISVPLPHADHYAPFLERLGLVGSDDEAGELYEVQIG